MKLTLRTFIFLFITASSSFSALLEEEPQPSCGWKMSLWLEKQKGHVLSEKKFKGILQKAERARGGLFGILGPVAKGIIDPLKKGKKSPFNLKLIWSNRIREGAGLERKGIVFSPLYFFSKEVEEELSTIIKESTSDSQDFKKLEACHESLLERERLSRRYIKAYSQAVKALNKAKYVQLQDSYVLRPISYFKEKIKISLGK